MSECTFAKNDMVERAVSDGTVQRAVVIKSYQSGGGFEYRVLKRNALLKTIFDTDDETGWKKVGIYDPS